MLHTHILHLRICFEFSALWLIVVQFQKGSYILKDDRCLTKLHNNDWSRFTDKVSISNHFSSLRTFHFGASILRHSRALNWANGYLWKAWNTNLFLVQLWIDQNGFCSRSSNRENMPTYICFNVLFSLFRAHSL